jgi:hypothetical protein
MGTTMAMAMDMGQTGKQNHLDLRSGADSVGGNQRMMWIRLALAPVLGALVLWIATGVTLNFTLGSSQPEIALAMWPDGAVAKMALSQRVIKDNQRQPVQVARSLALAREATLREPGSGKPVALLAALADLEGDKLRARELFGLSEQLSRRDLLAQAWLIEDAVQRGRIDEAVTHYNRALAVSWDIRPQLLPILTQAANDPEIRRSLIPVLAKRPDWWTDYMAVLVASSSSADALEISARAVRFDVNAPEELGMAEAVLRKLVVLKAYPQLLRLIAGLDKQGTRERLLRGGDFEAPEGIPPFAWWFRDSDGVRVYRDTVPGGSLGMWIEADAGAAPGGSAQQLIGLGPGRAVLSGVVGNVAAERNSAPRINIVCPNGASIGDFALPASGETGRPFQFKFDVPAENCLVQWVSLATPAAVDVKVWLDNLKISHAGPISDE